MAKKDKLGEYDEQMQELYVKKMMEIEKGLRGNDPEAFLKAQSYLQNNKKVNKPQAYLFEPFDSTYSGKGYKEANKALPYTILKLMGELPLVKTVHQTRIQQIQRFLKFTTDEQEEGFTIRKKLSLFEERKKEIPKEQHKEIENIVEFLLNSRRPVKKEQVGRIKFDDAKWDFFDDLDEFVQMTMSDSLTYDQLNFQIQRSRNFDIYGYKAIDASTVRILDTVDPRYEVDNKKRYDEVFGYLPRYAQVHNNIIYEDPLTNQQAVYYPWEMAFATRNKSTDIRKNMYGTSELEILKEIITYIQNGFTYNGNFFKQGSNPKGFINIKSGASQDIINDFRNAWRTQIAGVGNSHKLPILEGLDLEWVDLQHTNKDMEFQMWLEFVIIVLCSVYTIDPSELGFNFKQQSQMFGQDGQKERLDHSKDKGLKPLLVFLQKVLNKYIVTEINPEYEFVFTGIDLEDQGTMIDLDVKKLNGGLASFEDMFKLYNDREYDPKKDTILSPQFITAMQAKAFGGFESNGAVDQMTGEEGGLKNPIAEYEKGGVDNPIVSASLDYIDKAFGYKKQTA